MIRYVVKYDGTSTLYDSFDPDTYPIVSGSCNVEVNGAGSMSLSIPVTNSLVDDLKQMGPSITLIVSAYSESGLLIDEYIPFHGRILSLNKDMYGNVSVECEGALNFLNDVVFYGDPGYIAIYPFSDHSVFSIIAQSILFYNSNSGNDLSNDYGRKYIFPGYGQASQYEDLYPQYSYSGKEKDHTDSTKILELLMEIIVQYIGGFFKTDFELTNGQYVTSLTYSALNSGMSGPETGYTERLVYDNEAGLIEVPGYSSYSLSNLPEFSFGDNITSYENQKSIDEIYTAIYPTGSNFALRGGHDAGVTPIVSKDGYTLNTFGSAIYKDDMIDKYGYIEKAVQFGDIALEEEEGGGSTYHQWETACSHLIDAALQWADQHFVDFSDKYVIKGLEPIEFKTTETIESSTDPGEEMETVVSYLVRIMYGVKFKDSVKGIETILPCLGIKYDLVNHGNNEYTIGPLIPESYNETNISNS